MISCMSEYRWTKQYKDLEQVYPCPHLQITYDDLYIELKARITKNILHYIYGGVTSVIEWLIGSSFKHFDVKAVAMGLIHFGQLAKSTDSQYRCTLAV